MGKLKRTANNNELIAYWLDLAWSIEEKQVADIEEEISSRDSKSLESENEYHQIRIYSR